MLNSFFKKSSLLISSTNVLTFVFVYLLFDIALRTFLFLPPLSDNYFLLCHYFETCIHSRSVYLNRYKLYLILSFSLTAFFYLHVFFFSLFFSFSLPLSLRMHVYVSISYFPSFFLSLLLSLSLSLCLCLLLSLSVYLFSLTLFYTCLVRYEEAVSAYEEAQVLEPDNKGTRASLLQARNKISDLERKSSLATTGYNFLYSCIYLFFYLFVMIFSFYLLLKIW